MRDTFKHARHQLPVLRAFGHIAKEAIRQRLGQAGEATDVPSPALTDVVGPRPRDLVDDFIAWSGGDPGMYRGVLPPTLYPQWGFPLLARTLDGLQYPLNKVLNAGTRIELIAPIPDDVPLYLSARLEEVDDDGRRVLIKQRLTTSLANGDTVLVADLNAIIPLGGGGGGGGKKKARPMVPDGARQIDTWHLPMSAGFDFACLTGDFNPIHWVWPVAKASGFPSVILHGFGTLAKAVESVQRDQGKALLDTHQALECRFTRPVVLPGDVSCFVDGDDFFVGKAAGDKAALVGSLEPR